MAARSLFSRIPEELPPWRLAMGRRSIFSMQRWHQLGQDRSCRKKRIRAIPLSLSHRIRIKSAEFWLELGEADEALKELDRLPRAAASAHPAALKAVVNGLGKLRIQSKAVSRG